MNKILLKVLLPINLIIIVGLFILLYLARLNIPVQQELSSQLNNLKEQEKKINFILLETYFGYRNNFDILSSENQALKSSLLDFERSIHDLRNTMVIKRVQIILESYQEVQKQCSQNIDDFMSYFSALKNSRSYLPLLIEKIENKESQLPASLKEYLRESQLALLKSQASNLVYDLPLVPDELTTYKNNDLQLLESHNKLLSTHLPKAHFLVDQTINLDATKFLDNILKIQGSYMGRLNRYTESLMITLYSFFGSLLVMIIILAYELNRQRKTVEIANDNLEKKVAERTVDLKEARDEALRLAKVKGDFVAKMSHELRTPMNGIIGFTDLLINRLEKPENLKDMQVIKDSASSLLAIINDILDFSRIESGDFPIINEPFCIKRLLDSLDTFFRTQESSKVSWVVAKEQEDFGELNGLLGDIGRIRQILINIIGNAFKFTETGEVRLSVEFYDLQSTNAEFAIIVSDTGIGIKENRLKAIFNSFTQEDDATNRNYGGSGLGLSISNSLAELMGGSLSVESSPGKGSVFKLKLKLPRVEFKEAKTVVHLDTLTWKKEPYLLVVEDNKVNQKLILKTLSKLQCQTELAVNGQEALLKLAEYDFDLVLMDCQMPIMDGYEATRKIRASSEGWSQVPIIAISANAMKEDIEHCYNCGMSDFLAKPLRIKDLRLKLDDWLEHLKQNVSKRKVET